MLKALKRKFACPHDKGKMESGSAASVTPLSSARSGGRVKVKCIQGGRNLCARMAALGIYPGSEIDLVCSGCGCPCLVRVHGCTVSLGAGVSEKILVSSTSQGV